MYIKEKFPSYQLNKHHISSLVNDYPLSFVILCHKGRGLWLKLFDRGSLNVIINTKKLFSIDRCFQQIRESQDISRAANLK